MLPIEYPNNTQYMRYEYHRVREGPNYFVSYYKNSSRLHYDPKDTWRTLGTAKFTDSGKALKEWCLEMYDAYSVPQMEKWNNNEVEEGRKDTSFASEAMEEENPCSETKMVV